MNKSITITAIILTISIFIYQFIGKPMLKIASGYASKILCTNHFVNDRNLDDIDTLDLSFLPVPISSKVRSNGVTASVFGLGKQLAVFKEDIGCILVHNEDDLDIEYSREKNNSNKGYQFDRIEKDENIDIDRINKAIESVFDAGHKLTNKKTKAVAITYKGKLIAEQYALGNSIATKQLGWSMTKSIISTLVGMRVKDGKMNINSKNLVQEWQNDDRREISLNNLLQMTSGLEFIEDYGKVSDATNMLYDSKDMFKAAINHPLVNKPGTVWSYSSGTTNILSGLVKQTFNSNKEYYDYLYQNLFDKIGMNSAFVEVDQSGTLIGSSYCYATTRDWLKFGSLYLNEGKIENEQIITKDWIKYVTEPAVGSNNEYGAQIWLNKNKTYKNAPENMFYFRGFQGQRIFIFPDLDLVITRFGLNDQVDLDHLIGEVIESIK